MSQMLKGKWAVVTGASRGIGQQIAIGLAQKGANIIVHAREANNTSDTQALLDPFEINTKTVFGEFDTEAGTLSVLDQIQNACDRIDILYANHGIQNQWREVWDISPAEWQNTFQVNFFSMVTLCNGLIPQMVRNGFGRVILTTSGIPDIPQLTPYGCSKAAIDKYVFDLSAQIKDTGVRIHAMDPGWLRTDLGGPDGMYPVEAVLPGALVPVITDALESGKVFSAQDYRGL